MTGANSVVGLELAEFMKAQQSSLLRKETQKHP